MQFKIIEKTNYFNKINYFVRCIETTNKEKAIKQENERIKDINNKYNNIKILDFEFLEDLK